MNDNSVIDTITSGKRKLRYGDVERIKNRGTCCWKIFENDRWNFPGKRGKTEHIPLGYDSKPPFVPSSVKKTKCKTTSG